MDRGRNRPQRYRPRPARESYEESDHEGRSRPQGYRPRPTRESYEDDYERRPRPRRRPMPTTASKYPPRRHKRSVWPILMMGCGLGMLVTVLVAAVVVFLAFRSSQGNGLSALPIIGNSNKAFSKEDTTPIPLSMITQLQVCDTIGNVAIKVDPTASTPSVTTTKTVHVSNQSAANQEFQRIAVEIQPPGTITNPLACTQSQPTATPTSGTPVTSTGIGSINSALVINTTFPNTNGLLQTSSDAVDITVTLPQSVLPSDQYTMQADIEAPAGNITADGLKGVLNIRGSAGNINVSHAILASGSKIKTTQGNITFNGWLAPPLTASNDASYSIGSEQGAVDVTLPATTNVILDVNVNAGKLNSEFAIAANTSDNGVTYHGPLNTSASPAPTATLLLDVSSGAINIHKTQI